MHCLSGLTDSVTTSIVSAAMPGKMPDSISMLKSAQCLTEKEVSPLGGETQLFLASSI